MRRPTKNTLAFCAAVLLLVFHEAAHAGVIGPNVPEGTFELGLQYRGIDRQISLGQHLRDLEGSDGSLFLKYGLTNMATLSGEALLIPDISYRFDDDVDGEWRYYVVGAGLQLTLWERDEWTVEPGFHATQTLWFSDHDDQCDEKWLTLDWVLLGTYSYRWNQVEIVVWGGPGYFYINRAVLASARCKRTVWETDNNWGGTAGLNLLFYDRVQGFFSFVVADKFEPRFGLSYRF